MNCKNGERYLKYSLKSILSQKYQNWELIFVDNNSKDETKKIFKKYKDNRFKYIFLDKQVNLGSARQEALKNCSGDFISFLDTDDLWFEDKLEKQIKFFRDNEIGMVISNTIFFSEKKSKKFYNNAPPTGFVFFDLLDNYFISLETLICRTKYLKKISFKFNEDFSMISDLDLTLQLSMICKLGYCPFVLSKWRIHPSSDSWKKKNLFFLEKLRFIEVLKIKNRNLDNQKFLKHKKNFIQQTNYSIILNKIESGEKRKEIIKEIKYKNVEFINFLILLILTFFPFNRQIMKLYRKFFSITP